MHSLTKFWGAYRLIFRLSMAIPMSIMYGHNLVSLDDPIIVAAEEFNTMALTLFQPGFTLITVLPFLRHIPSWIPGAVAQKMAKQTKKLADMLRLSPLEIVRKQLVSTFKLHGYLAWYWTTTQKEGTALPSLVTQYIDGEHGDKGDEEIIGSLAFAAYSGAYSSCRNLEIMKRSWSYFCHRCSRYDNICNVNTLLPSGYPPWGPNKSTKRARFHHWNGSPSRIWGSPDIALHRSYISRVDALEASRYARDTPPGYWRWHLSRIFYSER